MALCAVCILIAGGYFHYALRRTSTVTAIRREPPVASLPAPTPHGAQQRRATRRLLFRSTAPDAHFGHLAALTLNDAGQNARHYYDALNCQTVAFAGGHGICLRINATTPGFPTDAVLFDADFHIRRAIPLAGIASRTRVSPDGKWGAVTVFTAGDSYASIQMSTKTNLIDMESGTILVDLEEYSVTRDGRPFKERDFNFWGVTFTKDNRSFYATLASGGKTYLVKGELNTLQAKVIRAGIECPSLSPDNTRVAFKQRHDGKFQPTWRLAVLDLATLKETVLAEPRTIDQQVQWFDNTRVLYALPEDERVRGGAVRTWTIAADGRHPPELLLPYADSPLIF